MKMNKLIKKIATATMALTLIAGVFTGCAETSNNATVATSTGTVAAPTQYTLSADVSLKAQNGTLPESGKIGDIEYEILANDLFYYVKDEKGYFIDGYEQENSPYFIVITSGPETASGASIRIVDIGEENGTLKIVVEETPATGDSFSNVYSPFCVLKVNRVPGTLDIRNTDGEVFENIET